jgi:hypothetical protein
MPRLDNIETVAKFAQQTGLKDQTQSLRRGTPALKRQDPLRRFSSTPLAADLQLMGRTVHIETNDEAVLDLAWKFFERYQHGDAGVPDFVWRLVSEPDPKVQSAVVHVSAFSDSGLQYVNIGQSSFLAVDLERREAIGFLSKSFFQDETKLRDRPPLDLLSCISAASLGLTALSGGCTGLNDRGVLVFGPPNSGKTTASYLAAKLGLEFHADQLVFLDMSGGLVRVWGDPSPAVFRPETLEFLPELRKSVYFSTYVDLSFYYFDKSVLQSRWAKPVIPVCSLFLDRSTSSEPQLTQISPEDAASRLRDCMLFEEDSRFDAQVEEAISALAAKPAYDLKYNSNPKTAATFIRKMLP